jgi:hypothetical protein
LSCSIVVSNHDRSQKQKVEISTGLHKTLKHFSCVVLDCFKGADHKATKLVNHAHYQEYHERKELFATFEDHITYNRNNEKGDCTARYIVIIS